jgi:hypothetical protein
MEGNSNQVGLGTQINRTDLLIDMFHLPVRRRQRCQVRHGNLLEIEEARPADFSYFRRRSCYQKEFH